MTSLMKGPLASPARRSVEKMPGLFVIFFFRDEIDFLNDTILYKPSALERCEIIMNEQRIVFSSKIINSNIKKV